MMLSMARRVAGTRVRPSCVPHTMWAVGMRMVPQLGPFYL